MNLTGQDWETVVLRAKRPASGPRAAPGNRAGAGAETRERVSGEARAASDRARKLEEGTAALYVLGPAARTELVRARTVKGLTQQQLAQQLNTKQSVIHDLEAGRPLQEGAPRVLAGVNRALGTHLRFGAGAGGGSGAA